MGVMESSWPEVGVIEEVLMLLLVTGEAVLMILGVKALLLVARIEEVGVLLEYENVGVGVVIMEEETGTGEGVVVVVMAVVAAVVEFVVVDIRSIGFWSMFPMTPYSRPAVSDPNPRSAREKLRS